VAKIVVTGAGGYVGGRLVPILTEAGWHVHGIVREPTPRLSIEQSLCDLGSPGSYDVVAAACEGADAVIHLAGENEVVAANRPAAALAGTVTATERVAEACAATGVRRLVYTSTMHVYGARVVPGATLLEEMRVEPRSVYAISRLASEHIAASRAAGAYELLVLRLTNTVGAPDHVSVDRWSLIVNDLCRQAATAGTLELRSDGMQWRDFVPLASVCNAIAFACETSGPTLAPGTYNLGSGMPRTVRSVAELIQDAFERETDERPPLHAPAPSGPPLEPYHVSVERASEQGLVLGDPLEAAILDTVRFCLQHREELTG
jgi:UDP-glucose 4-epimerase